MVEQENNGKGVNPYRKPGAPRQQQKKISRRFFPETTDQQNGIAKSASATCSSGTFFRNKKRIQNIDWKLAQAIQRVESLRLDGDEGVRYSGSSSSASTVVATAAGTYQPPPSNNANTKYS
jgi:hypothetical protein